MSTTAAEVRCPSCGTISYYDEVGRDAEAFCRTCDYPLFWARTTRLATADTDGGDAGLRRLPGTAGKVTVATLACPACTEPNAVTAAFCIRCGADLHPRPVEPVLPPPQPVITPPVPVVEEPPVPRNWWPIIVWSVLALIAVGLLIGLLMQ